MGQGTVQPMALFAADGTAIDFDHELIAQVPTSILVPHRAVHLGVTFLVCYKSPEGSEIADNASINFIINSRYSMHLSFLGAAGGDAELALWENTTYTDGSLISPLNMNRDSGAYPDVARRDVTVTAYGTNLLNIFLPGGTGGNSSGGVLRLGTEFVLSADTNYLLENINRAGQAQSMSLHAEWYEAERAVIP